MEQTVRLRVRPSHRSQEQVWDLLRQFLPFLGLVGVCVFFQIGTGGKLLSPSNLKAFSNYAFQMVVPACGAVFLMAQGNLDYSMAGNVCISAVLAAKVSHINPWLAPAAAIAVSVLIGWINGSAHIYLGVPSFVATLAASFMYSGLASVLLGGGALTANYALKKADTLYVKYGIILVCLVLTWLVLTYTPFGKHCRAIGAKSEVAHQSGVNMRLEKMLPFLICGFSCGIMAMFVLFRSCSVSTSSGGTTQLNTILALLLGGVPFSGGWSAKFRCVLIGSMLMAVITSGLALMSVPSESQQIIKGILFVTAVAISFDRKNTAVIK